MLAPTCHHLLSNRVFGLPGHSVTYFSLFLSFSLSLFAYGRPPSDTQSVYFGVLVFTLGMGRMETGLENIRYPAFCFHSYTRLGGIFHKHTRRGNSLATAFFGAFRRSTMILRRCCGIQIGGGGEAWQRMQLRVVMVVLHHHYTTSRSCLNVAGGQLVERRVTWDGICRRLSVEVIFDAF